MGPDDLLCWRNARLKKDGKDTHVVGPVLPERAP